MNRKTIALAAAALLAAGGMGVVYSINQKEAPKGMKDITIEVIHQDGSKSSWKLEKEEEFLKDVLLEEGLIEGEEGPYGLYVTKVDGETADFDNDQAYWRLQIDGVDSMTGVDETVLNDQSVYTWIYTSAREGAVE